VGFELTTLVVIGTDCTGSCKSNYHTITKHDSPVRYFVIHVFNRSNMTTLATRMVVRERLENKIFWIIM
jgi:hypothetical protein